MYIFVCSTLRVILQGFVTQNATDAKSDFARLFADYYNLRCVRTLRWADNTLFYPRFKAFSYLLL